MLVLALVLSSSFLMSTATLIDNPLLVGQGLPPFEAIKPEHVIPGITHLLGQLDQERTQLEATLQPTWKGLVDPLTQLQERLRWAWGIVEHLMGVKNTPQLRQVYEAIQPEVIEFWNRLDQSRPIYEGFKALRQGPDWDGLDLAQQRIVTAAIRDAELSGVGLTGTKRDRFNQIQQELAELSTRFDNNVLDATKGFRLILTQPTEVVGLPPSLLAQAAQAARSHGVTTATAEQGPWHMTLDFPSFNPFLKYSQRRDLREKVYRAHIQRASQGELDNTSLINHILELRQEKARLLGYETYADLSLVSKIAPNVSAVDCLMADLRQESFTAAVQDLESLRAFAAEQGAPEADQLRHWDVSYWSERQREAKFGLNDEELRPYFPLPQVLEGLFALAQRLFSVTITPADDQAPVWCGDVRYFQIAQGAQDPMAYFYLDPYSRPAEKRGGAWMDVCLNRSCRSEGDRLTVQQPVAYLICNQSPPVDDQPSLMTFREVETLFHEFGHGLHHLLTQVDYPGAAGVNNVEWDAVELPSQFMENWCYDRPTLMGMARHYHTGEPLPEEIYQKLLATRHYRGGSQLLRQIHLSLLDMELHHCYQPGGDETVWQVRDRLAQTTTVMPPLPEDAFLCSFSHIFAGEYAAGYYSYLWAEVLSADAFAAFEEASLEDELVVQATGRRFRDTVLALGGGQHPLEIFKAFRGREASPDGLLRYRGLVST